MSGDNSKIPQFVETGLKSLVTEVAFSLAAWRGDHWRASGSAVSVGNRLLITAKHVVEDYFDHVEERSVTLRGSVTGNFGIIARQMLREGEEIALWRARRLWLSPATDIAFVLVEPMSESAVSYARWRVPPFQLVPPQAGDRVVAFGYHTPVVDVVSDGNLMTVHWDDHPTTSVGEVIEVYHTRRDNYLLKFPSFCTNSRFEGGMSGGPVFNDSGEVCGLVCASVSAGFEEGHISYVASLWPAMATFIHVGVNGQLSDTPVRVLELAQAGVINARGWERVTIIPGESDSQIQLEIPAANLAATPDG